MVSDLVDKFLLDYFTRRPYVVEAKFDNQRVTTMDELVSTLTEIERIYRKNSDKTPEEIVDIIIQDTIEQYEKLRKECGIPGYSATSQVGNINVSIFGGKTSEKGNDITNDTLFDVASITKIYTQIVVYNLIKDGYLKRSDVISKLDPRFVNLNNVTVDNILTFSVDIYTKGRVDEQKTYEDALNSLYNSTLHYKNKYKYTDIGLMILKEVIEKLTGKTFEELVQQYIVSPLNLKNTYLTVPEDKYGLLTGTPNANIGHISDMKANLTKGGYSGHAGVFTNAEDLMKVLSAAHSGLILPNSEDAYTPSSYYNRKKGKESTIMGKMGNTYVPHIAGVDKSFVDSVDPLDTFGVAGSTRTNAAVSSDSSYTVLFNPSSVSEDVAREQIEKQNQVLLQKGKKPIKPEDTIKEYTVNGEPYKYIDPRAVMPLSEMENSVRKMAELTIKLRFLDFLIKETEKDYETTVIKHVG